MSSVAGSVLVGFDHDTPAGLAATLAGLIGEEAASPGGATDSAAAAAGPPVAEEGTA